MSDQFQAVGNKLKAELQEKKDQEKGIEKAVVSELSVMEQMQALYAGVEQVEDGLDRDNNLPILTIVQADEVNYQTVDGKVPSRGKLFHTGIQQEFSSLLANIFYVKECQLPRYGKEEGDKDYWQKNYVVGGVIQALEVPFWIYVRGLSYNKIWQLAEQMAPYRHGPNKLPKFAFTVEITTELGDPGEKTTKDGKKIIYPAKHVYVFNIVRGENGLPLIESDPKRIEQLKKMDALMHHEIDAYIQKNGRKDEFAPPSFDPSYTELDIQG